MKKLFVLLVVFFALFVFSVYSHAELWDRGCGMIYDDFSNITWTQDSRLVRPDSPYGSPDAWGVGYIGWFAANTWAENLEYEDNCRLDINGNPLIWKNWRLPSAYNQINGQDDTGTSPCIGYGCDQSEMGHIYYVDLENPIGGQPSNGLPNNCTDYLDRAPENQVCFDNLGRYRYWYGTPPETYPFWEFAFSVGYQGLADCHIGWAVRDGDVMPSPTPIPMDLNPGSESNTINTSSKGTTLVAILSTETFDATVVDPETISLSGVKVKKAGKKEDKDKESHEIKESHENKEAHEIKKSHEKEDKDKKDDEKEDKDKKDDKKDKHHCKKKDVNGDKQKDLLCKVDTQELVQAILTANSIQASTANFMQVNIQGSIIVPVESVVVLEAETFWGTPLRGEDTVSIE